MIRDYLTPRLVAEAVIVAVVGWLVIGYLLAVGQ